MPTVEEISFDASLPNLLKPGYPSQQIAGSSSAGLTQLALQEFVVVTNYDEMLRAQLEGRTSPKASSRFLQRHVVMQIVFFGIFAVCYLLSRTDWVVGTLLRKFSLFFFP